MLAVVPVRGGVLPAGGLEAIAECGGNALLIGSGCHDAAATLAGHAADVAIIEAGDFAPGAWATVLATHIEGLAAGRDAVVLAASPDGRDLAPRLAVATRRDLLAGAISVTPQLVELARSGGLTITDVRPNGPFVATLQPGVRGVEPGDPAATVEVRALPFHVPGASPAARTNGAPAGEDATVLEVLGPDAATMDLAEAPRIVGGGAGLSSLESFQQLADLATCLDASMGATRVVTDRGWVGHERQIGTTGVVVDPRLYVAFGISGAVQHTSGLGTPEHIVSVNTDPHCPMMQLADLAIVSDADGVVAELLARLGERGDG